MIAPVLCLCMGPAFSQSTSLTLYGNIDQYLNYMRSSSGATLKTLNDGALLRSRIGLRGEEALGAGLAVKFQLETGLSSDTGASADTRRFFDRQSWIGLLTPVGEFRAGRQNTAVFYRGDFIDSSSRNLGSVINNVGAPSRYDNDLAWLSPRWGGWMIEAHVAPGETSGSIGDQAVYQLAVDYLHGPYRVGYAGVRGKPARGAPVDTTIRYDNLYANYDHGHGRIFLAIVRTNNITSNANGNTAGSLLGGTGDLVAGNSLDAHRDYDIYQISADYRLHPQLRLGALWGTIVDTSDSGHGAKGASVGVYYDFTKRTLFYGLAQRFRNDENAGFRPSGSAGVNPNFSGADVNGQTIKGLQVGVVHRF
ncbi:MAG: porin [Rubrivivax sp.]|nr:MAG: porin [Rubrivivax sp.]